MKKHVATTRGLISAVVDDGVVDNEEIKMLYRWLQQHGDHEAGPLRELKFLIERICADSVVTSREREELLAFLVALRNFQTSEEKGLAFEEYVITRFNNRAFRLIEWRSDKYIDGWGGPIASQWPDIEMEHLASSSHFAVECKFRASCKDGKLTWADSWQINNYLKYQERTKIPVFVALGYGGRAESPKALYILRLDYMTQPEIRICDIAAFQFKGQKIDVELSCKG